MEKQAPKVTYVTVPKKEYPAWSHRPGTTMFQTEMNFVFMNGGMGDYITWFQAIRWLASEATWLKGRAIIPTYLKELVEYWLAPFPEWTFTDYKDTSSMPQLDNMPLRGPVELQRESLNATGAHLLTCGWVYFTNKEKAPEGWDFYPPLAQAHLDSVKTPLEITEKYAVITTGLTTNSRKVDPAWWNHIIDHVIARGLTPVFLGKSVVETGNARNIHTQFGKETHYEKGIDLRDKTSLMQAAAIMSRAEVVIGHDSGLLHLAGCTSVPIVFGYNIASPEHRRPRRPAGKIYDVVLTDAELPCNFCQSKFNFVIGYNFRECFYGDLQCMKLLFANGAEKWKKQIDAALEER